MSLATRVRLAQCVCLAACMRRAQRVVMTLALPCASLAAASLAGGQVVQAQATTELLPPGEAERPRLQAARTTVPLRLDGRLDEPAWAQAGATDAMRQVRPDQLPDARVRTVVRVLYDESYLYIGAMMYDSAGQAGVRVRDLRREFDFSENDAFAITLGPLGDRRSAYQFVVNPYGALRDVQAFDGGDVINADWDALWRARTHITDSGWTAEIAIPWASLRYDASRTSWDVNFVRNARRLLEQSAWSAYPRQFASFRLAFAGALDSLAPPPPRRNVRLRPYALADAARSGGSDARYGTAGTFGGEAIWAPTAGSVVELTANTDFAQAEVDRQVVNLERFSVFFPERRQFFLENTDVLNPRGLSGRFVVQPFFSRRIGLAADGTPRRLDGGGRYTWRSGRNTLGALAMHESGDAGNGASVGVLRGSRFLGSNGRVGAFAAVRHDEGAGGGTNVVTALDGLTRLGEQVQANGMLSTSTDDNGTRLAATYFVGRDTPGLYTGVLGAWVSDGYAPRTGFVSRSNTMVTSPAVVGTVQPSWRPSSVVWFKPALVGYAYHDPRSLSLQEGFLQGYVDVYHTNGALWYPYVERHWQRPTDPLQFLPGVTIAPGAQEYWRYGLYASTDASARANLVVNVASGGFFDGNLTRVTGTARWAPDPHLVLSVDADVSRLSSIGARDTARTTTLVAPEVRFAINPRLLLTTFYQYNTGAQQGTLNARFSWEFSPLSFLYVVWNDRRAIQRGVLPVSESLVIKLVWLRQL
jgi:hypothetical protein